MSYTAPGLERESWQCSKTEGGWIQGQELQVHGLLEQEILALWHSKQAPALQWEGSWLVDANICVVGSGSEPSTWDKSSNDKSNELLEQFQDFSGRPWDLHLWRAAQKCQAINSMPCLSSAKCSLRPGGWTLNLGDLFQPCEPMSP